MQRPDARLPESIETKHRKKKSDAVGADAEINNYCRIEPGYYDYIFVALQSREKERGCILFKYTTPGQCLLSRFDVRVSGVFALLSIVLISLYTIVFYFFLF